MKVAIVNDRKKGSELSGYLRGESYSRVNFNCQSSAAEVYLSSHGASQSVGSGVATLASTVSLLEILIHRPHPKLLKHNLQGRFPGTCFKQCSRWFLHMLKFENHCCSDKNTGFGSRYYWLHIIMSYNTLIQSFSKLRVHQNHLEALFKPRLLCSALRVSVRYVYAGELVRIACLINSQGMLVWGPHFENHCRRQQGDLCAGAELSQRASR